MAIIEAMSITDEIRKMIINRSPAMEIGNLAVSQGMKTLRMVALEKVKEGLTTLEQVLVVTAAASG
jgi:type IV pilus assembly protein PilB